MRWISKSKCLYMVYSLVVFLNFQANISKFLILWISQSQIQSKCLCMVYPFPIFLNFQTNISKCLILWISQSQIFVSGISLGYLHSIPPRAPAALGALRLLRTRVATAFFATPFTTAMRRSSVAATDRPPGEVCPPKLPQPMVHVVDVASAINFFCPANLAFCPQNALFAQTPSLFAQRSTYVTARTSPRISGISD